MANGTSAMLWRQMASHTTAIATPCVWWRTSIFAKRLPLESACSHALPGGQLIFNSRHCISRCMGGGNLDTILYNLRRVQTLTAVTTMIMLINDDTDFTVS